MFPISASSVRTMPISLAFTLPATWLNPRVDAEMHAVLARDFTAQDLDRLADVSEAERVRVQALQRERARLDDLDRLRVATGVDRVCADHRDALVHDYVRHHVHRLA